MDYYINLEKLSLDSYMDSLKTAYLPPSRRMLRDKVEERKAFFSSLGIRNAKELMSLLAKKDRNEEMLKTDCLSEEYLKILLREIKSLLPKPVRIRELFCLEEETVSTLEREGIINTLKLYNRLLDPDGREHLIHSLGLDETEVRKLRSLADLCRVRWVGATFACMLLELGMESAARIAACDPESLHERVNDLNRERGFYKGQIGLNDMKILVETAAKRSDLNEPLL